MAAYDPGVLPRPKLGLGLVASGPDRTHQAALDDLLTQVNGALETDKPCEALRLADRARRLAQDSAELRLLCSRLLLKTGDAAGALTLLDKGPAHHVSAMQEASRVEALLALGRLDEATGCLERALLRFAVNPESPLAAVARQLARQCGDSFPGWIALTSDLEIYGELPPSKSLRRLAIAFDVGTPLQEHLLDSSPNAVQLFRFPIADQSEREELLASVDGKPLLGGSLCFPPIFELDGRTGWEDGKISGWVSLAWDPHRPLIIAASTRDGLQANVTTSADPVRTNRQRFALPEEFSTARGPIRLQALLPGGHAVPLPDSPFRKRPARLPMRSGLARFLPRRRNRRRKIDIIVPVYRGRDATLRCLKALLATRSSSSNIIVIDDASPDLEIQVELGRLAAQGEIELIRNEQNLGFPAAVNLGLSLHRQHDAVILNSDTIVFPGWLERLSDAAYRTPFAGTVTPLSNTGSIASYPSLSEADCSEADAEAFDRLTAQVNVGVRVDLPTGVGFCLYIRRDCLDDVGLLDSETFGRGYGEENDLCQRAAKAGWRNILAADVFVQHAGGISFGRQRGALLDRNLQLLQRRHPNYQADVERFIALDPLLPVRRQLDKQRLITADRTYVLLITLALPGGVAKHVRERCTALRKEGLTPLIARPEKPGSKRHVLISDDPKLENLTYDTSELNALNTLLSQLAIDHIELHHFLGLDARFVTGVLGGNTPYDIYIHDFSWYCPRLTLLNAEFRYCGEPELAACERCVEVNGSEFEETISVAALRERSGAWLRGAREIIAPSRDAADRLRRKFPGLEPKTQDWEETPNRNDARPMPSREKIRVAVIGAIGKSKGYDVVLACAEDAKQRDLPLEFSVIGYSENDDRLMQTGRVFVTGAYEEKEIGQLIEREDPHIAFFPSVWPETWCYAMTHALRAGLVVCAFDIGAISERLRKTSASPRLFPLDLRAEELNDRLLEIARGPTEFHSPSLLGPIKRPELVAPSRPTPDLLRVQAMDQTPQDMTASVQVLTLSDGLYLFGVRSASPSRIGGDAKMILPAVNITVCPGTAAEHVEFLSGPAGNDKWLFSSNHLVVVKVSRGPAMLLLTSVRTPGLAPLDIEVQMLSAGQSAATAARSFAPLNTVDKPANKDEIAAPSTRLPSPTSPEGGLRLQVVSHVQHRGDLPFIDGAWAGCIGEGLWIESFSIIPLELLSPDDIEYKGLTATGLETPWTTGGAPCGTKGQGIPLVGFAVRVKPQSSGRRFECQYSGTFLSGSSAGPLKNGAPCLSTTADDALEAICVAIVPLEATSEFSVEKKTNGANSTTEHTAPPPRTVIGPRFSVFRETSELEPQQ